MTDNVLLIWKQGDSESDRFHWYLMEMKPHIKFTVEREKDGVLSLNIMLEIKLLTFTQLFLFFVFQLRKAMM